MADLLDALVDNLNGTGQAGDGLELAEDLAGDVAGPAATMGKAGPVLGGAVSVGAPKDEGQAVGEVEGRRMGVMRDEQGESLESLASSAASIALLGLPGKAVTAAVGSKL